jgi:hypothetical protein
MARPGTDLEPRRPIPAYERAADALGTRLADALDRRRHRGRQDDSPAPARIAGSVALKMASALDRLQDAGPIEPAPPAVRTPRAEHPVVERLAGALERRLARAVERRLGGRSSDRVPGAFEQRIVAALTRRMGAGNRSADVPSRGLTAALRRTRRSLMARPGRPLPAERRTTVRALVVGVLARSIVRALVRVLGFLGRGLISTPMRRITRILLRRAARTRPGRKAGLVAILLGAIALVLRRLARRFTGIPAAQRAALVLGYRLLRAFLPRLGRLLGRGLRGLIALIGRRIAPGSRRAPKA